MTTNFIIVFAVDNVKGEVPHHETALIAVDIDMDIGHIKYSKIMDAFKKTSEYRFFNMGTNVINIISINKI